MNYKISHCQLAIFKTQMEVHHKTKLKKNSSGWALWWALVVVLISLAEWYATHGSHLFLFKSLGLLAVSLDNGNAGVVLWCQLSKGMEQGVL